MELERKLDVLEKLINIYTNGKESGVLGDQAGRAIYSALNDMTSQLMRTYPEWFKESKEVEELKETVKGLMEEISVAEEEMELHGHRL